MPKKPKTQASEEKKATKTVVVQVKPEAPFDVLKHGKYKVGKFQPVEMPADVANHRHAGYLMYI